MLKYIKRVVHNKVFSLIDFYFYTKYNNLLSNFKQIGVECKIARNCFFGQPENIVISDYVIINDFCHFWGLGGITIGKNTMIASHCAITTVTHEKFNHFSRDKDIIKPIIIGDNVWLGAHVVILPGITIGDNAIIAAGAIVNKNVPAHSVYAGVPAKQIS